MNLLSNALKFTPREKFINVVLTTKKRKKKDYISISVQDEGIGISVDKQELIFERFGQENTSLSREAEGTGVGLYLVKLLVESLSGEISFKSEVGNGSAFTVLLPIRKQLDSMEKLKAKNRIVICVIWIVGLCKQWGLNSVIYILINVQNPKSSTSQLCMIGIPQF